MSSTDISNEKKSITHIRHTYYKGENYDRIIKCCQRAHVEVVNKSTGKYKDYDKLIESCNKRKKEILKNISNDVANIINKISKNEHSDAKEETINDLEKAFNNTIKNLKIIDKIISYIDTTMKESDKNNTILRFMKNKKNSEKKYVGKIIDSFSINEN